jgi:hypothetical protein
MSKSIISVKINRINILPGIDSISSVSLLINRIENGGSTLDFKKIIVLHDNYLVSKDNIEEMEAHIETLKEDPKSETSKVYSENLKNYMESIIGENEEIFIVSGFYDFMDQMNFMEIIYHLFGSYKINVFNTLSSPDNKNDFSFCQSNIQKFLNYILEK